MLELVNLLSNIMAGKPLPVELQTQIDGMVEKFAETVARQVVAHMKGETDADPKSES